MYTSRTPITKEEVRALLPDKFEPVITQTRFKNGTLVPVGHAAYSKPRLKREWSFEGTHKVKLPNGSVVTRPGQYVIKMRRP